MSRYRIVMLLVLAATLAFALVAVALPQRLLPFRGLLVALAPLTYWCALFALIVDLLFVRRDRFGASWRSEWFVATVFFIPCAIAGHAALYLLDGMRTAVPDLPLGSFVSALYFSSVTWTTLGYGDITPSPDFLLVAASEALLGYITMSLLIGSVFLMDRR